MTRLEQLQTKVKTLRSLEAKQQAMAITRLDERYSLGSLGLTLRRDINTDEWVNSDFKLPGSLLQKFIAAEKALHEHLMNELRKAEGTLEAIDTLLEHDNEHS